MSMNFILEEKRVCCKLLVTEKNIESDRVGEYYPRLSIVLIGKLHWRY